VTQWRNELEERFRGKVGNAQTQTDAPFSGGALIEVFTNNLLGHESEVMINRILTQYPKTLLVADECHHLGSEKLGQRILNRKWQYSLGLTATLERSDGNIDAIKSGIGAICFTYGIADGIRDGSLAQFDLVEYAIKLLPAARVEYDELDEKYKRAITRFRKVHDPEWKLSGGQLIAKANAVNDPLGGMLLGARNKRREFVASNPGKIDALKSLQLHKCQPRPRALLFAETREMTEAASAAATKGPFLIAAIDHKKSAAERDAVLRAFSTGKIAGIAGPKILDEGINLPSADLGIILARTFSSVQMVQRFGRVLRRTQDKHRATIIVMYFEDTFEDLSHRESETSDVWSELRQAARNHLTVSGETLQQILDRLD
jgi:superfamily II DNA or RNA helicase